MGDDGLRPGLEGHASLRVDETHTAEAVGSGTVPVLATPEVIALVERAAVAAVEDRLVPGRTSVGARIELDHVAPTPIGGRVEARATLEDVDGRMLSFGFEVRDGAGTVAKGRHVRAVVDRDRFVGSARARGSDG